MGSCLLRLMLEGWWTLMAFRWPFLRIFPKFESLVFLGISVHQTMVWLAQLWLYLSSGLWIPVFPCRNDNHFEWDNKWLGWFKVVFKIVAGSQSESYDSTISRSVGFISSYKVFLKNIQSQKYIRLRSPTIFKGAIFQKIFSRNRCPKISKRKSFRRFNIFFKFKIEELLRHAFENIWWKKRK